MSLQSTSTLPFTAHVRTSLEPHFEPFTSSSFCPPDDQPCPIPAHGARISRSAPACLRRDGSQHPCGVHLEQAELLLGATASPARARSDFGRLWCWPALSSATAVAPCDQVCSAGIHAATCEQFGGLYAYCLTQHRAIASSKIWRTHWMTVHFISWLLYFPSQLLTVVAMRAPFSRSMRAFMCVTSICCSLIIADALPAAVDTKTPRD
jgi:hypothetical protein